MIDKRLEQAILRTNARLLILAQIQGYLGGGMDMNRANKAKDMTLKGIYEKFIENRPQDFTGHSLSVSDVVTLHQNGSTTVHYVDRERISVREEIVLRYYKEYPDIREAK